MNETIAGSTTRENAVAPSSSTTEAVKTVGKDGAVTTAASNPAKTPTELFVANVDGKYLRFEKLEHVPAGCRTYTNKRELLGQTQKQVEAVYAHVKGIQPKSFKDKETAADNLWSAFGELPLFVPKKSVPSSDTDGSLPADAGKTDTKKKYQKKRAVDIYKILPETDKTRKALEEFAPQAKACVEIIRADGKAQYTEDELKALMEANRAKLRTKQIPWRIFQYYRGAMVSADILIQQ
jgi:hypothetical protein